MHTKHINTCVREEWMMLQQWSRWQIIKFMPQNSVETWFDRVTVPSTCAESSRLQFVGLMFSSQPGTTVLRPSVPSQERDWTSVIIRHTHIPQDQGSTPGAATSSGLSQGRASRTWWNSRYKQREELLDAVRVETAEGKPESEETNWKKFDPFGVWHIPCW